LYLLWIFVTNLLLNLALVPLLGMWGAAISTAAVFVASVFYLKHLVLKHMQLRI
jgi:O-antigen/teichoic acid export membrane protein